MKSRHHLFFVLIVLFSLTLVFISEDIRTLLIENTKIDTIGHFFGFFCLCWVLHSLVKLPLLNTALAVSFYAALTEIGQYYLGFRNGEVRDFVADILGISLFVLLKWAMLVYTNKRYL